MDQIKTGKFIAERRREKGMTQAQLAEKIGVSDRAVSKWETGRGMPEYSLLIPLCRELEISVNELLNGERLSEEEYREKFEETFVDTIADTNTRFQKKWLLTICGAVLGVLLLCFLTDLNRMRKGQPVIFSKWGMYYHQEQDLRAVNAEKVIREYFIEDSDKTKKISGGKAFASVKTYAVAGSEEEYTVSCWIMQSIYYKEGNTLKEDSASSVPYKIKITVKDGTYTVSDIQHPRDGAYYVEDMKKMFSSDVYKAMEENQYDGTIRRMINDIEEQARLYFHI